MSTTAAKKAENASIARIAWVVRIALFEQKKGNFSMAREEKAIIRAIL